MQIRPSSDHWAAISDPAVSTRWDLIRRGQAPVPLGARAGPAGSVSVTRDI